MDDQSLTDKMIDSVSRRGFLKTAGVVSGAVGGMALTGSAPVKAADVPGGKQYYQPEGLFDATAFGYSQVVTSRPGTFFYVAGLGAFDGSPEFNVVGATVAEQFAQVGLNLDFALAAIGAQRSDVTMIRLYVVGYKDNQLEGEGMNGAISGFLSSYFPEGRLPATSWVGVEALASPLTLVEAEVQGIIPALF